MASAVIGHDDVKIAFYDAWKAGRLHHAWLLAGPQGMGKAAFAAKAARFLVTHGVNKPKNDALSFLEQAIIADSLDDVGDEAANHLVSKGNHPEILHLKRLAKEKGKEVARSISIDQVRQIIRRLQMSLSMGAWRVIIIDAIDDLELSGANALLKTLEEPPAQTIFLLISHSPGKLLPTIRSRCRTLRFQPVNQEELQNWMKSIRPMLDSGDIRAIADAAGGVPGKALSLIDSDVATLEKKLMEIAITGDPNNGLRASLAKELGGAANRERLALALDLVPSLIAKLARNCPREGLSNMLEQWDVVQINSKNAISQSYDGAMIAFGIGNALAALSPLLSEDVR